MGFDLQGIFEKMKPKNGALQKKDQPTWFALVAGIRLCPLVFFFFFLRGWLEGKATEIAHHTLGVGTCFEG